MLTEKQKMLRGQLYKDSDPQLVAERQACQRALEQFNGLGVDDDLTRKNILRSLLGGLGDGSWVMPRFQCDYGYNIMIGSNSFLNYDCILLDCAPITIGDDCSIGPRCQLLTASHPIEDHQARRDRFETAEPIRVGSNVWFGGGVIVCPGVTIGDDAVVGAGSVVTKDAPPRSVVVGNPARVLRRT